MQRLLDCRINELQGYVDFYQRLITCDCDELRECVRRDLYLDVDADIDANILNMPDAISLYRILNAPTAKTRNWLIQRMK
jgi:hypothetical protein